MENILKTLFAILVASASVLANANEWKSIDSEIKFVFIPKQSSTKIELIRLYKNNVFEHLIYTPDKKYSKSNENLEQVHKSNVKRNTGTYSLKTDKLSFTCLEKDFTSDIYTKQLVIADRKIYKNKLQSLLNKKEFLFKSTAVKKYEMPFYLDPISNRIVTNSDAEKKLDLSDLVNFLTKKKQKELDKYQAIIDFLQKDIALDEELKLTNYQKLDEQMVRNILSGNERTANSKLLAESIAILGKLANLNIRSIDGVIKQEKGFGYQNIEHSWNQINSNDKAVLSDAFMGDNWLVVNPNLMIFTHFPNNETDQLLEHPISITDFNQLVWMEPKSIDAKFNTFLPAKHSLTANNKVDVLINETPISMKIEFFNFNVAKNEFDKNATSIPNIKTEQFENKTYFNIPVEAPFGKLVMSTPNGFKIVYLITNNGQEETEVRDIIKKVFLKKSVLSKTNNTLKPKLNTTVKVLAWENSTEPFLKDLSNLIKEDPTLLQSPLIAEARKFYGQKELEGEENNKVILEFFKGTGNGKIKSDEVAWCSVFVGYCARKAGYDFKIKPAAKSWLEIGKKVTEPKPGDIVIFWREDPNSWKGHVSIFIGKDEETNEIICLGGNQDDQVCIRKYNASSVLGFRHLEK